MTVVYAAYAVVRRSWLGSVSTALCGSSVYRCARTSAGQYSFFVVVCRVGGVIVVFFLVLIPIKMATRCRGTRRGTPLIGMPLRGFTSRRGILFGFN